MAAVNGAFTLDMEIYVGSVRSISHYGSAVVYNAQAGNNATAEASFAPSAELYMAPNDTGSAVAVSADKAR